MPALPNRLSLFLRLALIWVLGTLALALAFTTTLNALDQQPLSAIVASLPRNASNGQVAMVLGLCAVCLLTIGATCRYAWRNGPGRYSYIAALGLGLAGGAILWTCIAVVFGAGTIFHGTSGFFRAFFTTLIAGLLAGWLNLINLLFVIPQIIWFWHREVSRSQSHGQSEGTEQPTSSPATDTSATPWPRRRVLLGWAGIAVILALIDRRNVRRHQPLSDLSVALGENIQDWMKARGEVNFDSTSDGESDGGWVYTVREFIPDTLPANFVRDRLRVTWAHLHQFNIYTASMAPDDHAIYRTRWSYTLFNSTHEDAMALAADTIAQFQRGAWTALPGQETDADTVRPNPAQPLRLEDWMRLIRQGTTVMWQWQADGVEASLRAMPDSGSALVDKANFWFLLDFKKTGRAGAAAG